MNSAATGVVLVEQDSLDEIAGCVETIIRTPRGLRDELPDFGSRDRLFTEGPLDTGDILDEITDWDGRAELLIEAYPDAVESMAQNVRVTIREGRNA